MLVSLIYKSGHKVNYHDVNYCFVDPVHNWFVMNSKSFRTHEKIIDLSKIKLWDIRQS